MIVRREICYLFVGMLLCLCSCSSSKKQTVDDIYSKTSTIDKGGTEKHGTKPSGSDNKKLYSFVKEWLGVPYKYGGNDKSGVDCSGLTVQLYKEVYGIKLQRSSARIFEIDCKEINKNSLKEGDLVFFTTSNKGSRINHVGVFLKDGTFIHAGSKGVTLDDLESPYYKKHYICSGKVKK